jgi:hypothetical protein
VKEKTRTVHLPLELHTKLKIEASIKEIRLRDLVIEILQRHLQEVEEGK